MSYHTTHNEHYILIEPEHDYLEVEDLDEIINQILGDFSEVAYVIFFLGSLNYLNEDDIEQFEFLDQELKVKNGYLLLVTQTEQMLNAFNDKISIAPTLDEAIETIESEWLDKALFSDEI